MHACSVNARGRMCQILKPLRISMLLVSAGRLMSSLPFRFFAFVMSIFFFCLQSSWVRGWLHYRAVFSTWYSQLSCKVLITDCRIFSEASDVICRWWWSRVMVLCVSVTATVLEDCGICTWPAVWHADVMVRVRILDLWSRGCRFKSGRYILYNNFGQVVHTHGQPPRSIIWYRQTEWQYVMWLGMWV